MKKLLLVLAMTFTASFAVAQEGTPGSVLASGNGRFVFGQISKMARDQYMLDTQTGRLWQVTQSTPKNADGTPNKDAAFIFLDPVPYSEAGGRLVYQPTPSK